VPDIFLSYNREDQATARRFADAFHAEGLEVWWDTTLRAGEAYDQVTERALKTARAVVVLWSVKSVESRWVRAEATLADRNKTLLPAMIEPCERPIMFELTQTADLTGWDGDRAHAAWQSFVADVRRFIQAGAAAPAPVAAPPPRTEAARRERVSVCVLPFANMSRDDDQEYFADGISEDIITDLSKVSALGVIARNSAFAFKGKTVDITQVAHQLNVTHVLEGSVRKAGNRVRITAQLIDGSTNEHVWAERWDRDLDDIFELQDEISQAIVAALKVKLAPQEKSAIEDRGTANLEAYDRYLRARALTYSASTLEELYAARDACRQVLEIDPDFALARGALATVYAYLENFAPESLPQLRKERDALADEAMRRAPDHWTTHLLNGVRQADRLDWTQTMAALEKALALAPSSEVEARWFAGQHLGNVGRVREWIGVLEAARAADPLSTVLSPHLQMAYFIDGRDADSRAEYDRTLDLSGMREIPEHTALFREWDTEDAEATQASFKRYLDMQSVRIPFLARCLELLDTPAAALELAREALDDPANQDATRMMIIGIQAGLYGDEGTVGVEAFRRALLGFGFYAKFMIWWPSLKRARRTPQFKQLVRDLRLYDYWRASGNWGDFARPVGDDDFEIIR
jgi:adenylate cyclase